MVLVRPIGSKIDCSGRPYFWISCLIFRYDPKSHFYIHFWNSNSRKKIPWHRKKFIFEGRFLQSNTNLNIVNHIAFRAQIVQWLVEDWDLGNQKISKILKFQGSLIIFEKISWYKKGIAIFFSDLGLFITRNFSNRCKNPI